ncbi:MAG: hypothetical protein OXP36_06160 [Gammaproteobacteria bacterium]|nr:hypothetical protein [Gammaproteobacteria bacterium]
MTILDALAKAGVAFVALKENIRAVRPVRSAGEAATGAALLRWRSREGRWGSATSMARAT